MIQARDFVIRDQDTVYVKGAVHTVQNNRWARVAQPRVIKIRVEKLIARLIKNNISKYNLTGTASDLPKGYRILVPGQVEDDASIELGADKVTDRGLRMMEKTCQSSCLLKMRLYKPCAPHVIACSRSCGKPF